MALGSNPDRESIWTELFPSNFRNGGTDTNALKQMDSYVFGGDGSGYTRDGFGGTGKPECSSLTATGGNSEIDVTFTVDHVGGLGSCTIVAQYWDSQDETLPIEDDFQNLGTVSSTGQYTRTITNNVSNGVIYDVRVTVFNLYNNAPDSGNLTYPEPNDTAPENWFDWTNIDQAETQVPTLSQASLVGETVEYSGQDAYLNFNYSDAEDSFIVEFRFDGGTTQTVNNIECDSNVGTSSNPKEIKVNMGTFPQPGDTVELRITATASGYNNSQPSAWETATLTSLPSCPL
jgi:hypothetical protein